MTLGLIGAINAVMLTGLPIVSCEGKRYTPQDLAPIWCGDNYAAFKTCGMTKTEREGAWRVDAE